jgi:hypothetical protein
MRVVHYSLLTVPLLAVGLQLAPTAPATDESAPWLQVDTNGKNAVVLEFARNGDPVSTVLVREGELGSIRFDEREVIGFVPEWIADRGDGARLGMYRVGDQYAGEMPGAQDWIEDVPLSKGDVALNPRKAAAYAGEPALTVRLVDTILVAR